jgi:hypothetical protein
MREQILPIKPSDLDPYKSSELLDILADILAELRRRQRAGRSQ